MMMIWHRRRLLLLSSTSTTPFILLMLIIMSLETTVSENAFDDTVLFRMTWPGSSHDFEVSDKDSMLITTLDNEKYQCLLPMEIPDGGNAEDKHYSGPNALELLYPLFTQLLCSYRLEQYWTYELCHGKYIKQYHDEKDADSKSLNRQEFVLGQYDLTDYDLKVKSMKENEEQLKQEIPYKNIEGQNLPYFPVYMTDGTMCDLSTKPRSTNVLYICYPQSKHHIYSLEEVSTCEYEMVVLTPLLCSHPDYRHKVSSENDIMCRPLEGAPRRPLRLEVLELEALKYARKGQKLAKSILKAAAPSTSKKETPKSDDQVPPPRDTKLVKDFLSGDYCLFGGSGWWKFEFCYGKKVEQYHEEKDSKKTIVSLGVWSKEKHLRWMDQNPHKRPKKGLTQNQISHLYSDGSLCDQTGTNRQVEVKFKCKDSSNLNAVSLYLLEPKTCEYILVVESSILCELIDNADENGLFTLTEETF